MYRRLRCFQYFATKNNAAMSNFMHMYFCLIGSVSSGLNSKSGIAGQEVKAYVALLDVTRLLP